MKTVVRKGRREDADGLFRLVVSLARFEHLRPPTSSSKKRLVTDIFDRKRLGLFVAVEGTTLVGYALYFFAYSSFLARPTLYLEDVFVDESRRGRGVGGLLLARCASKAVREGCGRMEWSVLTWNAKAVGFYEDLGAKRMDDWITYRLAGRALEDLGGRRLL